MADECDHFNEHSVLFQTDLKYKIVYGLKNYNMKKDETDGIKFHTLNLAIKVGKCSGQSCY